MAEYEFKAIIYEGPEDVYGPCGCGMDMAIFPVLLPLSWAGENPMEVDDHEFGKGLDYRRVSGFSCNRIFEHEQDGSHYLANFSCCRECADRAVECGYAIWTDREYPMTLR